MHACVKGIGYTKSGYIAIIAHSCVVLCYDKITDHIIHTW